LGSMSITDNTLVSQGMRDQPDVPGLGAFDALLQPLLKASGCVFIYDVGQAREGSISPDVAIQNHIDRAAAPRDVSLPDGRVLFHGNQVTFYDARVSRHETLPAAIESKDYLSCALLLVSSDDISLQDNQIRAELPGAFLRTDTFALGNTVRTSGNRFAEVPERCFMSYRALAAFTITTANQATHCIVAEGGQVIEQQNQVMVTRYCTGNR
jgi:hypothetical protein